MKLNSNMYNFVISKIVICILLFSQTSFAKPPKVFISDLETLGEFSEIQNFPNKMFEGTNNATFKQKAATAGKKMSYYFITKKKSLEKYPHNMMKAMGYFEVYYMQTLEDKKFNLARFKDDDYNSNDIKNINTLLSLNKARKSMREAVGLTLDDSAEEAINRFWLMNEYLSKGKVKTIQTDTKISKKKKTTTELRSDIKGLKNIIEKRIENRVDSKDFKKEINNYLRNIKKKSKSLRKDDLKNIKLSNSNKEENIIDTQQLQRAIKAIDIDILQEIYSDNSQYQNDSNLKKIINLIDLADYSLSKINLYYPKKYVSDLSKVDMSFLEENELKVINEISKSSKINKNIKNKQLLNTLYNLQNNEFDASAFISKLNNNDIITEEVSINFKSLADMQNWSQEEWAQSYTNEIPKEIIDDEGNVIEELSMVNIEDIKAQLALSEFQKLSNEFANIADELKDNNFDFQDIIDSSTFSISLDKYDKFYMTFGYNDFNEYVTAWNASWDEDYSRDELVNLINEPQNAELSFAIDAVNSDGLGFDAGSLASSIGMELADVATTVANAVAADVAVDLEAVSKGLGYSSFADAVSDYNATYGTNYSESEAKEALGM